MPFMPRATCALLLPEELGMADQFGADLSQANLNGTDLGRANLRGAKVTQAQLDHAYTLEGATLPDGTVYE
jgi:uncharacterized protein YjbI with pentapeptide repeats